MFTVLLFLFTRMHLEMIGFVPARGEIMIIESSNLGMASHRSYQQRTTSSSSTSILKTIAQPTVTSETETAGNKSRSFSDLVDRYQSTRHVSYDSALEQADTIRQIRSQMLDYLFRLLFGGTSADDLTSSTASSFSNQTTLMQTTRYETSFVYSESETTSFSAAGTVNTADGRSLDINLNLIMSRSFTKATSEVIDYTQPVLCDPLVINLTSSPATVSDQTFFFDLDADGTEEEISQLSAGSGYLAFDKNGDGSINDGSELFGVKSGNGFADLMAYDSDGNGWIDEADPIFSKLQIWSLDENGNSTLTSLKKAGVGAIYLGSSDTDFALKGADNSTNAVIRRTGIFLYEDGTAGTMQQMDLAVHQLDLTS